VYAFHYPVINTNLSTIRQSGIVTPFTVQAESELAGIVVEDVTKTFPNGFLAVRDLNLNIADGEFMVPVGASGCGKTTPLRLIAGLAPRITAELLEAGEEAKLLAEPTALFSARVDPRARARVGMRLRLAVDPLRPHFFDPVSGGTPLGGELKAETMDLTTTSIAGRA
jgi:energy-coupling factor transporter ATP-binding protein EcfA2